MAKVRLGRHEAEEGQLPPLCMYCGAPAALFKIQRFSWHPAWSYVLLLVAFWPLVLLSMLLRRRMRVFMPLCLHHQYHRLGRRVLMLVIFILLLGIARLVIFALPQIGGAGGIPRLGLWLWLVGPLWLLAGLSLRSGIVRPSEINEDAIVLTGVARQFVDAYRAERPVAAGPKPTEQPAREPEVMAGAASKLTEAIRTLEQKKA